MNLMAQILINVIIAFLAGSLLLGFHRKVMARVQLRPGPPIIQYLLHSLKFFFKETSFPKTAAMPFYVGITVILAAVWVTAVIVGPVAQGSLMIIFGVYAIHKIVEHNAGSSSGSPYGKLSCVRAVFSAVAALCSDCNYIPLDWNYGHQWNYSLSGSAWSFSIEIASCSNYVLHIDCYKIPIFSFCHYKRKGNHIWI